MKDTEIRSIQGLELRTVDGKPPTIVGHAAVFNKLSHDLGGFREKIEPGAFTETIKSSDDIRSLVNHDANQRLARTSNGTLTVSEDKSGLLVEIDPPLTTVGRDTVEDIRTKNLDGMSFMFRTIDDRWETKDGEEIRTLEKVELIEAGPVTFPAYPDTAVAVRSLAQHKASNEEAEEVKESTKDEAETVTETVTDETVTPDEAEHSFARKMVKLNIAQRN